MRMRDRYGAWGLDTPTSPRWEEEARCREVDDPDIFFPRTADAGCSEGAEKRAYAAAKRVCAGCPVWQRCRAYAIERGERYGMWGGLTPRQIRREHDRAMQQGGAA